MIDKDSIETLKQHIDIVDVIGSYIELKKAGANFKANCPFHGEKTPSFVVSPTKQIFHCFGCGIGGDAVKFVMEYEKLSYPEAIEKLASQYNFTLKYTKTQGDFSQAKRVLDLLKEWYYKNLDKENNALNYLYSRGISRASIENFEIGYAPSSKEVMNYLNSLHIPLPVAEEAGVVAKGERGYYARLSDRVIFPIFSPNGSIVGFGGRTMVNHPAKYINSPQTKLFNKSRLLYGYSRAKEYIYRQKSIIVCEGYLDVIMLHQAGFKNAVATLGTALTQEHLPLLRKGEPKIVLAYDGDSAGVTAALKASRLLSSHGFEGRVVLFPDGKDPADMVASRDIDSLKSLLSGGDELIAFVLKMIASSYDLSNPYEKEKAVAEAKDYLMGLGDIVSEAYIPFASSVFGVATAHFSQIVNNSNRRYQQKDIEIRQEVTDPAWQVIIKTLIANERLVDDVVDIISPEMAGPHKRALDALFRGERDDSELIGIEIDEDIPVLEEDELKKTLILQVQNWYIRKLKSITADRSLPYQKKSWLIRKIKTDILPRLKKGELVAYESDFTI